LEEARVLYVGATRAKSKGKSEKPAAFGVMW
jgi:hypothetical protein